MNLENSKTQKNLMTAFLRESGAFNEYSFYADQAKQEGYVRIYQTFNKFARNEQAHAKIWFSLFHEIKDTKENLKDAVDLENYERTKMYAEFSKTAKEEGFLDIAKLFDEVAEIEKTHEEMYKTVFKAVKDKTFFVQKEKVNWQCLNCGHIHNGKEPPERCPVCSHPKSYFAIKPEF